MGDLVTRLLLCLVLVSWSPAWCCCGIRIGLDRVAGAASLDDGQLARTGATTGPRCPRCLEALLESADAEGGVVDVGDRSIPTRLCGCHDHGRELLPTAELSIPPLTVTTCGAVVKAILTALDAPGPEFARRHARERGQPPPRVETLLDLGCRLTV